MNCLLFLRVFLSLPFLSSLYLSLFRSQVSRLVLFFILCFHLSLTMSSTNILCVFGPEKLRRVMNLLAFPVSTNSPSDTCVHTHFARNIVAGGLFWVWQLLTLLGRPVKRQTENKGVGKIRKSEKVGDKQEGKRGRGGKKCNNKVE